MGGCRPPRSTAGRQGARRTGRLGDGPLGLVRRFGRRFEHHHRGRRTRSTSPLLGLRPGVRFWRTPTGWHQSAEFESPETNGPDWFGDSVAVSGNNIVVGAPAISVLPRGWAGRTFSSGRPGLAQSAELGGPGTVAGDCFGDRSPSRATRSWSAHPATPRRPARCTCSRTPATVGERRAEGSDTVAKDDFGDSVAISPGPSWSGLSGMRRRRAGVRFHKGTKGLATSGGAVRLGHRRRATASAIRWPLRAKLSPSAPDWPPQTRAGVPLQQTGTGWHQSAKLAGPTLASDDFGTRSLSSGDMVVVGTFAQAPGAGRAYLFISRHGLAPNRRAAVGLS